MNEAYIEWDNKFYVTDLDELRNLINGRARFIRLERPEIELPEKDGPDDNKGVYWPAHKVPAEPHNYVNVDRITSFRTCSEERYVASRYSSWNLVKRPGYVKPDDEDVPF